MQLPSWDSHYSRKTTLQAFAANIAYHWPYLREICLKAKTSAIEIGCGRGIHSIFLSYFIPNVVGIDNNIKIVEKATKDNSRFRGRTHFLVRDAFKVDFPDKTFDVCFSQGFLEHFTDEEINLLTEKQLRIARVMVASVPSAFYPAKDRGDERLIPIEDWRQILKDFDAHMFYYGFKPKEPYRVISPRNLTNIPEVVLSKSHRTHICMVVKSTNTSSHYRLL